MKVEIALREWRDEDFSLLEQTLGDPEQTLYLGGPESSAQLQQRHQRFLNLTAGGMFTIRFPDGTAVGTVGYWQTEWQSRQIYEAGWMVLPNFAGRGIATEAARQIIGIAILDGKCTSIHAFPNVKNLASNAVCRKAGFVLRGAFKFEYPKGHEMICNDWACLLK